MAAKKDLTGLIGRTIIAVHPFSQGLAGDYGWDNGEADSAPVIELDDGTLLFPSQDEEGNGAGALFGRSKLGDDFVIFANPSMGPPRRA